MKTNALITLKAPLYFLIGFLGLAVTSCGSYQNSSYYDNDGVYSTNGEKIVIKDNQPNSTSVQYKQYFSSLQNTGNSDEIFTDVNSYGSGYNIENDSIQTPSTGYASWGSSPQETHVTVYPDTYWYAGWGWGYPYYGYPYYGWGYPYYGWGYPGYGWGYPGYGWGYPGYGYGYAHVTPYAYNYSRRGSSYGGNYNNNSIYNNNRINSYTRNNTVSERNSMYNRNSNNSLINRTSPTFTNRNSNTTTTRNYTQNQYQSRNSNTQSRTSNSSNYQQSSYTPSSNSSYRSSGSNMSSGGGSSRVSSGGGGMSGGGGRMSGGGGRR